MDLNASPTAWVPDAVSEQNAILGPCRECVMALWHRLMLGSMVSGQIGFSVVVSPGSLIKLKASSRVY